MQDNEGDVSIRALVHMKKDKTERNGSPNMAALLTRGLLPYLALAVLLALSVAAWRFALNVSRERDRRLFTERVDKVVTDITGRLERYKMILQGGAGLFLASDEVTRDEWRTFYEYNEIHTRYPGIQGVGFMPVVRSGDLARHIAQVRGEGFPDYTVRPAGEREAYAPVVFVEPFDAINQRALGFDAFSEPVRREAMARARDTGRAAFSGRVTLVQDQDDAPQPGFVLVVPIYTRGVPPEEIVERRAAIWGYVYAMLRIHDLMDGIFPAPIHEIDFRCHDGDEVSPPSLVYGSHTTADGPRSPMFTTRRTLDLYGRQWTLDFETMPAFEAQTDRHTSWIILGSGVVISLLMFLFLKMLEGMGRRAESLARQMTLALRQSEERYRLIAENMEDVVFLISEDKSKILYINPSYEKITGRTCQSLYDSLESFMEPVHPDDLRAVKTGFEEYLKRGRFEMEYRIIKPDGEVRWIYLRAYPTKDDDGRVEKYSGMATDITDRKRGGLYRDMGREVLRILNESSDRRGGFDNLVATVKDMSGFDAVGIRLQEGDDFPYFAQQGFEEAFLRTENSLVAHAPEGGLCRDKDGNVTLECMCGLVISGGTDPANPLFTKGGSFWTNNASSLLDLPPDLEPRLHPRNQCIHQGYASQALVPIRTRDRIVGLIQLNDRHRDCFTLETVEILEGIASHVGVALLRYEAEARLLTFNAELEQRVADRTRELTVAKEGADAATARAVEARKQVEQAIRERELFFAVNLDMLCIAGFDGYFKDLNPSWERILGYSFDELRAKPFIEFVHPEDRQATLDATAALSCGEDVVAFENRYRCKDGSYRWIEWNSRSVIKECLIFAAAHDVTDSKRLQLELRAAKDEAEAATQAKSAFLANMSHELRTPLNAVIGFSEALEDRYFGDLAEKQAEYVRCITESGQHLLALINDILDLSKVEAGKMTLELGPVRVGDLLENSLLMVKEKCFKHRIALNLDVAPELRDLAVEADARKLKQIVFNLLSNSAKFTPDGGSITVEARLVSDRSSVISHQKAETTFSLITDHRSLITSPAVRVEISVTDTGIGIPHGMQEKVFESFFQVNGGTKDKSPGTGLGLPLVKRLAELHGGAVAIESAGEGKGCRVTVRLPTGAGGQPTRADEPVGLQPSEGRHGEATAAGRETI